jgi:hypothetical protein
MEETSRRKTTVTSSSNEISTNQHGNRVRGEALFCSPPPLAIAASGQIFKDDVNRFASTHG